MRALCILSFLFISFDHFYQVFGFTSFQRPLFLPSTQRVGKLCVASVDKQCRTFEDRQEAGRNEKLNSPTFSHSEILWSYVPNLQGARHYYSFTTIKSLLGFLADRRYPDDAATSDVEEPILRAVVHAIRLAAKVGDYKLILNLIDASIHYADGKPILQPRIFGEAIHGLTNTTANPAKIKKIWKLAIHRSDVENGKPAYMAKPVQAFELNVLIKALSSRGKIGGALNAYKEVTEQQDGSLVVVPDAYTLSTIFAALCDSISKEQAESPAPTSSNSSLFVSPCWQWNEANNILTNQISNFHVSSLTQNSPFNNHVFASLLKLNERASHIFREHEKEGPKIALNLLNSMRQLNISPDVVTCTHVISNLGYEWQTAIEILGAMNNDSSTSEDAKEEELQATWKLPPPNKYTYSAAIATCARSQQYRKAMELLEQMRKSPEIHPNTWVYNAALLSTATFGESPSFNSIESKGSKGRRERARERLQMVFKILREMEVEHEQGFDSAPDTITYNTVLAALSEVGQIEPDFISELIGVETNNRAIDIEMESPVIHLLNEMKRKKIGRDSITYRNAILASSRSNEVVEPEIMTLLDMALVDSNGSKTITSKTKSKKLEGPAADGITFVFNTALSVFSSQGDKDGFLNTIAKMAESNVRSNGDTIIHLISSLGHANESHLIPELLNATGGNNEARMRLVESYPIEIDSMLDLVESSHFSTGISICLKENDIESARKSFSIMSKNGIRPTTQSLEAFARAYAKVAVTCALEEARVNRTFTKAQKKRHTQLRHQFPQAVSKIRAMSAYNITMSMHEPTNELLSTVAKACATVGNWHQSRSILRLLHKRILSLEDESAFGSQRDVRVVQQLHRKLLESASVKGNVTAALWFVDDIQRLCNRLRSGSIDNKQSLLFQPKQNSTIYSSKGLGMDADKWKLLIIAASKSGHWRVCLSSLQFLRPYLTRAHPSLAKNEDDKIRLSKNYDRTAGALTVAVKCMEVRSQYAWAVRSIDDWIEWSGRRPPKAAVLAATRVLSLRSRGQEVNNLLARCIYPQAQANSHGYESMLYAGAITALHKEGLYDDADEAFMSAIVRGHLQFSLNRGMNDEKTLILDLHGMNVAVAHSAVRVALQQEIETASWNRTNNNSLQGTCEDWSNDVIIVTGIGRNSALKMRPVLRPEVQRMLLEEFYPPLNSISVVGNMGAVRIPAEDVRNWLSHQRQQKGARLLTVAAVLKNVSSLDILRQKIALSLEPKSDVTSQNQT